MRHLLVCVRDDTFLDALRAAAEPSTTFLSEPDPEEALERLARSARIDAVVTDDVEAAEAVRAEIPGSLPIVLAGPHDSPEDVMARLDEA